MVPPPPTATAVARGSCFSNRGEYQLRAARSDGFIVTLHPRPLRPDRGPGVQPRRRPDQPPADWSSTRWGGSRRQTVPYVAGEAAVLGREPHRRARPAARRRPAGRRVRRQRQHPLELQPPDPHGAGRGEPHQHPHPGCGRAAGRGGFGHGRHRQLQLHGLRRTRHCHRPQRHPDHPELRRARPANHRRVARHRAPDVGLQRLRRTGRAGGRSDARQRHQLQLRPAGPADPAQ